MTKFTIFNHDENAKEYQQGVVIFEQGEPGDVMYVVIDGEVEVRLKSTTINKIGANEIFGEMALLDDSPRSASAYAKTDCKLVLVDQGKFKSLIQQDQDFAIQVMRVMAGRLRKVTKLSVMEKIRILNPTILEKLYLDE